MHTNIDVAFGIQYNIAILVLRRNYLSLERKHKLRNPTIYYNICTRKSTEILIVDGMSKQVNTWILNRICVICVLPLTSIDLDIYKFVVLAKVRRCVCASISIEDSMTVIQMVVSLRYIRINMFYRLCDYHYMILIIFKVISNIKTHLTWMNRFKYISMPQTTGKKNI